MADDGDKPDKLTLDKDLDKVTLIEDTTRHVLRRTVPPGVAFVFACLSGLAAAMVVTGNPMVMTIAAAAVLAAYMAMNIGANDVTNNVGAAVGARAITLTSALVLAAIFEIAGALIGGDDVVNTIREGIVSVDRLPTTDALAVVMLSALFAAALWINLATWLNAPVSTTHSIIGAIIGAASAEIGISAIDWSLIGSIVVAWILSPVIGGGIAALLLWLIHDRIVYQADKVAGARIWVPILIAVMIGGFSAFILIELPDRLTGSGALRPLIAGLAIGLVTWSIIGPRVARLAEGLDNRNQSLKTLFRWPLVLAACLLSFAHGANDVANAIGPLAAIVDAAGIRSIAANQDAPLWVVMIGALGIPLGLLMFGPRLIRVVGEQITKLNPVRAYCVSSSTAFTVILASSIGLPVSSTHVAVGSVFGVGLFREWYNNHSARRRAYLAAKGKAIMPEGPDEQEMTEENEASRYRYLVRRSHLLSISAAWLVTVPLSGGLAAIITLILSALSIRI